MSKERRKELPQIYHLNTDSLKLNAFEKEELSFGFDNALVEWSSSDEQIASVDGDGWVTALRKGVATITATADLPGGGTATDSCEVEVLSTGYHCESPDELQSEHPYIPGEDAVWQYTLPGADSVLVSFSEETRLGYGAFLLMADGDGEAFYVDNRQMSFVGDALAGQTLQLPGDSFRIYLVKQHPNHFHCKVTLGRYIW